MKILITSGGTKVPIDTVRHIANMSSGTFGSKICEEALIAGDEVTFFRADNSKSPFKLSVDLFKEDKEWINRVYDKILFKDRYSHLYTEATYKNFDQYFTGLEHLSKETNPDVIILAAAVSDYGVDNYVDGKIRTKSDMSISLKPLPKVISNVKNWAPNALLVGFKLLVNSNDVELIENAKKSIVDNKCDMVVANDLRDIKNNDHRLIIVKSDLSVTFHNSDKNDPNYLARKVIQTIKELK
jgi:phosphopantothenate-cysteine ligase